MSVAKALAEAYARLDAINQGLTRALEEGAALESLEAGFLEKARLMEGLSVALDPALPEEPGAVSEALVRQAEAARSETRLAEALGKRRLELEQARNAETAYRRNLVDKSPQKRLDLGS